MKIGYYLASLGKKPKDALMFNAATDLPRWMAQEVAEHIYKEKNGDLMRWPLRIGLVDLDGKPLGVFLVDKKMEPQFEALDITTVQDLAETGT